MEVSKIILPSVEGPIQVGIKDTVARLAISELDVTPDVTDNNVTLEWGTLKEIATIGELSIHVTLPNNPSVNQIELSEKGVANGVATLDANGKVPASQLPSYVDDVIEGYYYEGTFYEESSHTTQIVAETGKIYIDLSTNKSYRWGGSTMVEIAGGGGSVHGKITVDLVALINGAQASVSLLNGVQITLTNTTRSRQIGVQIWAGQTITFDELTPMENYSVAVSNWDTSIWAAETSQQTITSLGIASTENVQFEFEADEYTCTVTGSNDGRVVVDGTEYANGETFRVSKGSTIAATAKAVQNYVSDITTSNKTITATYTAYGTITISTLSNLGTDSTIEAVVPTIKVGDAAAVSYTTPVQVAPDAEVVITWPAVNGYKAPAQQTVVKNGTTNETVSGTYQTEVVTVTVGTDETGVTAEGQIITINGSNYTVGSTGVVTAKVPFDTVYSISANAWTGLDDYTAPEAQTNITAAIASRSVTMTYLKIRGTLYNLVVTDNQNGDSGAATDATVTVTYLDGTSTVTLGTAYKSGDSFLIPNGGTDITVTGNASFGSYTNKNFVPSTELSGTTYTVTYKAQKVTVTSNSSIDLILTSSSSTIASGTSTSINGYVAWEASWSVNIGATENAYPTTVSPSSGTADSASASVSVTTASYTLITSGAADLGLPSGKLWAATNVGASNYYDDGLYFSWGDTTGHAVGSGYNFSDANYTSEASGSGHNLTGDIPSGNATYDAATANMGGSWRMPTYNEWNELENKCTLILTTLNNVTGHIVVNGGKGIFLPASGYYLGTSLNSRGSYGNYWSTRYLNSSAAYDLYFSSGGHGGSSIVRRGGLSVRAIKDPESLDMGNGVQWATGNLCKSTSGTYYIGSATDYGAYFSWGDINGHYEGEGYDFSSTNYSNGTSGSGHNLTANFTSGDATYDAARAKLGGTWRIPTYDELSWLNSNCTWTWKASGNTDYNGVPGYEVVGTNSNKIFMPASGYFNGTSLYNRGSYGYYWSTRYYSSSLAYYLLFSSSYHVMNFDYRRYGFSVRPVK